MPSSLPVVAGEDRSCAGWRFHRGGGRTLLDSVGDARVVVATAVKGWCRRGDFPL